MIKMVDAIPESSKQRLTELLGKERAEQVIESARYAVQKQVEERTSGPDSAKRKKYRRWTETLEKIIRTCEEELSKLKNQFKEYEIIDEKLENYLKISEEPKKIFEKYEMYG